MLVTKVALLALTGSTLGRGLLERRHDNQQAISFRPTDSSGPDSVREHLIANEIIGDVLDDFSPSYYVDLKYAKHDTEVALGNEIKTKYVKKRPSIGVSAIPPGDGVRSERKTTFEDTGKTLTLILTDPDATSRYNPEWSEMCHWIVTNLTNPYTEALQIFEHVSDPKLGDLKKHKKNKHHADELVPYLPPGPPPKTGWHRYVFVLLEGDAKPLTVPEERKHWGYGQIRHGVRDWAVENQLTVVGANFFFAENKKQD